MCPQRGGSLNDEQEENYPHVLPLKHDIMKNDINNLRKQMFIPE